MDNRLISIGFGNYVPTGRVIAVLSPDSAPVKRVVADARARSLLADASFGRKTRSVIVMDSGHVVLCAVAPETITARMNSEEE